MLADIDRSNGIRYVQIAHGSTSAVVPKGGCTGTPPAPRAGAERAAELPGEGETEYREDA